MKYKKYLTSFLLLSSCNPSMEANELKIVSIPFSVETFVPVTDSNIEKFSNNKSIVTINNKIVKFIMMEYAKSNIAVFDEKRVRLKITGKNLKPILVDSNGVIFVEGRSRKIPDASLQTLQKMVNDSER